MLAIGYDEMVQKRGGCESSARVMAQNEKLALKDPTLAL